MCDYIHIYIYIHIYYTMGVIFNHRSIRIGAISFRQTHMYECKQHGDNDDQATRGGSSP